MTFQRENRYIVIKRKDLKNVPVNYRASLVDPMFQLLAHLPIRECLVIESDWPEYEPAWRMIQARVEGATLSPAHVEDEREEFDCWFRREDGLPESADTTNISAAYLPWKAWKARAALSAPPAAGVPEAVHVLRKAYEGNSAGLFNSGAPKHLWSAAMLELFESLDEEVQEEARETVMAHSDMRAVAAIDSVIALLAAPTPPASEQHAAEELRVLREYRDACIGFNNSLGAETETPEDALQLERQAETRLEAAEKSCHDFYAGRLNPPAFEQKSAVSLDAIDKLRIELLPEYEAGYTAVAYGDSDQPVARADGMTAREAIAELLRLNPHLAKGEGV